MAWAFMSASSKPAEVVVPHGGPSLKARAMRLLARREHSREELRRKLAPKVAEGENLEAVLDDLAVRGWLSDARYAELSIRAKSGRYGPIKLAHGLRAKGVDDEVIATAFRAAGDEGLSNVESVWKTRFNEWPSDDRERARQVRFLQGRGFSLDAIMKFLRDASK
jgi:regulatory protein